jgi:hypothetical protein
MGSTSTTSPIVKPIKYDYIVSSQGAVTIDNEVASLISEPFCPVCKAWQGRSETRLLIRQEAREEVLRATAGYAFPYPIYLYSAGLVELVLHLEPRLKTKFRDAFSQKGTRWYELLAPSDVSFCGIRDVTVPKTYRCGRCSHLAGYTPEMKYVGTYFVLAAADIPADLLFYTAGSCPSNPPDLIATPEGIELLKKEGFRLSYERVAVLDELSVDRNPPATVLSEST